MAEMTSTEIALAVAAAKNRYAKAAKEISALRDRALGERALLRSGGDVGAFRGANDALTLAEADLAEAARGVEELEIAALVITLCATDRAAIAPLEAKCAKAEEELRAFPGYDAWERHYQLGSRHMFALPGSNEDWAAFLGLRNALVAHQMQLGALASAYNHSLSQLPPGIRAIVATSEWRQANRASAAPKQRVAEPAKATA